MFLWFDILPFIHRLGGGIVARHQVHPHSNAKALFQPTLWTLSAHEEVNLALSAILTAGNRLLLDAPSEEGLAAGAGPSAIVLAQGLCVATDQTLSRSIHGELRNVAYG